MNLPADSLPPGMTVHEGPVPAQLADRLEAFCKALQAVYSQGHPPEQQIVTHLREGLLAAQQVALGPVPLLGGDASCWNARCTRQSGGGCCLTLLGNSHELSFTLDRQQSLYAGFGWEVGGAATFFSLQRDPAGWTLYQATDEEQPRVLLGESLPWTVAPHRGLEEPEETSGYGHLFGLVGPALAVAAAVARPTATGPARCPQCHRALEPDAKFCAQCGAPVGTPKKWACAACHKILEPESKFCSACGTRCSSVPPD